MQKSRVDIELQLETAGQDTKFSTSLSALMQREDQLLRNGTPSNDIRQKIDVNLERETIQYYSQVLKSHLSLWINYYTKLKQLIPSLPVSECNDKRSLLNEDDLELENLRLQAEYNRNYLSHESFNLNEAFALQAHKIETEYSTIEKSLSLKLGRLNHSYNKSSMNSNEVSKWYHPEKQRRLIHTAPVLSPSQPSKGQGLSSYSFTEEVIDFTMVTAY